MNFFKINFEIGADLVVQIDWLIRLIWGLPFLLSDFI